LYHIVKGRKLPSPTITFAFIIATLYGALFHLIRGGDIRRLAVYMLAGWLGFLLGQMVGMTTNFPFFNIGPIHMIPATFGAIVALFFTQFVMLRSVK
jgi:uncharacterized membrane protein YeaQ/YmgE (transglycosylase-associated protein family)